MNIENAKKIRDFLANLPDEKFNYKAFIGIRKDCGTAGCVAGWIAIAFCNCSCDTQIETLLTSAREFLDIQPDSEEETLLFFRFNQVAKRVDAISRLNFLIDGYKPSYYNFNLESWYAAYNLL